VSGLDTIFKDVYANNTGTIGKFRKALDDADVPAEIRDMAVALVELETASDGTVNRDAVLDFFEALDEVTQKTAGGIDKARESLRSIAQEAEAAGKLTADELTSLLEQIANAKTPEELQAVFAKLNELLGVTTSQAKAAADEMQRLIDLIDKLSNSERDADEASRRLAETRDRVTASFTENGAGIDANTEAGRKNADAIQAQIEASERLAEAQALLDPTGQQSTLTLLAQRVALEELAAQGLLTAEELARLIDIYNLTDQDIQATVSADVSAAEASLAEVQAEFNKVKDDLETPVQTEIQALIDQGKYAEAEAKLAQLERDRVVSIKATITTAVGGVVAEVEKVTGIDINANGVIGRAAGGPVWPGQPFLVGEDGPELGFFPRNGQIIDAETTERLLSPDPQALTLDPLLAEVRALREAIGSSASTGVTIGDVTVVTPEPEATPRQLVRAALLAKAML
jgi:DNA repair exonuclease SbcCD ATPase subunit